MTLLRTQLGNTLRGHRLRQRRTLRDVSGAARVSLGLDSALATVASAALGCSTAALAIAFVAPEREFPVVYHREVTAHLRLDGARKERIIAAVRDQLGIPLTDLAPYRLDGSAGSTPCRLVVGEGTPGLLFGKL